MASGYFESGGPVATPAVAGMLWLWAIDPHFLSLDELLPAFLPGIRVYAFHTAA